ncbi:MAG: hypothetical protein LBJ36_10665 [Synergistaceae bacterium]|jgi:hypothetical protein|nr:hypothetical protein [Synergistaceae bacterium]
MLNDPKTISISQGDGKNTSITLYSTDTLATFQSKLNAAIANALGQAKYAVSAASYFATFVEDANFKARETRESKAGNHTRGFLLSVSFVPTQGPNGLNTGFYKYLEKYICRLSD